MKITRILARLIPVVCFLIFVFTPARGQQKVSGNVIDGAGHALPDTEVRIYNSDGTQLDVKTTGSRGEYSLTFPTRDTIYITYKHRDLAEETVPYLSGKVNHVLTKVLIRPSIARAVFVDQSVTDSASLENASANSCQTQFAELGLRSGSPMPAPQPPENKTIEPKKE